MLMRWDPMLIATLVWVSAMMRNIGNEKKGFANAEEIDQRRPLLGSSTSA
jgi:hypothetical protein